MSSRDKYLFKLLGFDSSGISSCNIVALSQGSIQNLVFEEENSQNDLSSFCERTANIISGRQPSFKLTCTIKTIPVLASLNHVMAFGMLGGVSITYDDKSKTDGEYEIKIFDNWSGIAKNI